MLLEFDTVEKTYKGAETRVPVLRGVSFGLSSGQTLALTGESGSGKSTIMHIAAGLEGIDSGVVKVAGKNIGTMNDAGRAGLRRKDVAVVFQQFNLIPSINVSANILFQSAMSGSVDQGQIDRMVEALGLSSQLGKYPEALSGGQQQRVAIARALAARPKLLLADEPTGNLDEATADEVMGQMLDLVAETGAALMIVTHSAKVAARMNRTLHLQGGLVT